MNIYKTGLNTSVVGPGLTWKQKLHVLACVQDQVVRDARGGGAQPDNLHDFNPFSNDQAQTKVGVSIIHDSVLYLSA